MNLTVSTLSGGTSIYLKQSDGFASPISINALNLPHILRRRGLASDCVYFLPFNHTGRAINPDPPKPFRIGVVVRTCDSFPKFGDVAASDGY